MVALAIWGPAWWATRGRTAAMVVDVNSELAPARPEVETIGAAGVAVGATGEAQVEPVVPMQVTVIDWPKPPRPARKPKALPAPDVAKAPAVDPAPEPDLVADATKSIPKPKPKPKRPPKAGDLATAATSATSAIDAPAGPGLGPGVAPVLVEGVGNASFATGANLLAYAPPNHIIAVYVRLATLRDTPWEPMVEAILRPMPDYRALLGKDAAGGKTASSLFDSILISTSSPRHVNATMLAVRPRVGRGDVRKAVAGADKILWRAVRGGALGERQPGDGRAFLAPAPELMLLVRLGELRELVSPVATAAPAEAVAPPAPAAPAAPVKDASPSIPVADIDAIVAQGALPPWLSQLMQLEAHVVANSPAGKAPLLMMTAAIKPSPKVGERLGTPGLALPTQMTLSVIMEATGFVVRGNLVFADAAAASAFAAVVIAKQAEAVGDPIAGLVLSRIGAKNALLNFSLQPTDRVLAFSTSISAVDAKKLLTLAGRELASYFAEP